MISSITGDRIFHKELYHLRHAAPFSHCNEGKGVLEFRSQPKGNRGCFFITHTTKILTM